MSDEFTADEFDKGARMCTSLGFEREARLFQIAAATKRRQAAIDNEFEECRVAAMQAVNDDMRAHNAYRVGAGGSTSDESDHMVRTIMRGAFAKRDEQEAAKVDISPTGLQVWFDIKDVPMGTRVQCINGGILWRVQGGGVFENSRSVAPGFLDEDRLDHYEYVPFKRAV